MKNNTFSFDKNLFNNSRLTWLWLIVRLYVGYAWLHAGWGKVTDSAWVGENAGASITGFLKGAIAKTSGAHPAVQGWYGSFLENLIIPNSTFFSYIIAYGELLVGIALILGIFTGIAAFFGAFMNLNFLLAGTTSTNPILFTLAILLILARKPAGVLGLGKVLSIVQKKPHTRRKK